MTLHDLSRILDKYESQLGSINTRQFDRLKGLPFYDWSEPKKVLASTHFPNDSTTFNHTIGLPQKNGQPYPLFNYEKLLFDTLQNNKHVWIKKATGLPEYSHHWSSGIIDRFRIWLDSTSFQHSEATKIL